MKALRMCLIMITTCSALCANAAEWYVSATSGDDLSLGTNWLTAKQTIQAAVNAAGTDDTVWVTNGTYDTGATVIPEFALSNRVVITKNITVRSLNGPQVTIIKGAGPLGPNAVRGVYMSTGILSGFTVTNGHTKTSGHILEEQSGGGIYCDNDNIGMVTNCIVSGNSASYSGGGITWGEANNCTFNGNLAEYYGGGLFRGRANHCTFSGNEAGDSGGGMHYGTATSCTFTGNTSTEDGGGMYYGTANSCIFSGNSAAYGGGKIGGEADECTFGGNTATNHGGGMRKGTASNCTFSGNSAPYGGGMSDGAATDCTFSGNTATEDGGGMYEGISDHCIFDGNTARFSGGMSDGAANHCTFNGNTATEDGGGMGNGKADNCLFSGNSAMTGGGMLYGTATNCTFSGNTALIGGGMSGGEAYNCIVWGNTATTGDDNLSGTIATYTCSPGLTQGSSGNIAWDPLFIDVASGDYRLQGSSPCREIGNNSYVTTSIDLNDNARIAYGTVDMGAYEFVEDLGTSPIHYVSEGNPGAQWPHTNWATAAATIQGAVNTASENDTVWVADGTYSDGRTTITPGYTALNRVVITKNITVRSLNGPEVTFIEGEGEQGARAVRGVYMSAGTLSGFTIAKGRTQTSGDFFYDRSGGGILCSNNAPVVVTHCIIRENKANIRGGGMRSGIANNCIFDGNTAAEDGGGMSSGMANNCTFSGNEAAAGGGISDGRANNCIVWGNTASFAHDNLSYTDIYDSCSPDVTQGTYGNITSNPLFIDAAGGDYHPATNSPCIDAGNNVTASGSVDADGNPRIANNTVDMGAYEFVEDLGSSPIHYVSEGNPGAQWPYTSWATAAATIQTAINTSSENDTVLVTNGTYAIGTTGTPEATLNNRVVIIKDITVCSINGPEVTIIEGSEAYTKSSVMRGVYMSAGTLSGFTVTNGHTKTSGEEMADQSGGGIYCANNSPVITNCTLIGNTATKNGGGMCFGTANNCIIRNNTTGSFGDGGGMYFSTANHCIISENTTGRGSYGGGMHKGTANNCIIIENTAGWSGGGMSFGTANNCTISSNTAEKGGGMYAGAATNCIIWGNIATEGDNIDGTTFSYTYIQDPLFIGAAEGNYRLQPGSPCIDAGNNTAVSGTADLDGNPRISSGTVDRGAYETAYIHYVNKNNSGAQWPYTDWTTAATTIQDAVDAATSNDTVLVTNGTYTVGTTVTPGAMLNNRVVITKDITVLSVNGPEETIIEGAGPMGPTAVRGVYMSAGTLSGFTITNGHTQTTGDFFKDLSGGGISCQNKATMIANCIISGNTAHGGGGGISLGTANRCVFRNNSAANGGGISSGIANNSTFRGNTAEDGGGMYYGTANNCTFSENTATDQGGGMRSGTANNCIVWGNSAVTGGNDLYSTTAHNTCSPDVANGTSGNIISDPLFLDTAAGNYHLQNTSYCINSGDNGAVFGTADLDGNLRILNGIIDMGAYEALIEEDTGSSPIHYVSEGNIGAQWPYTNWAAAAATIQVAVDTASATDTVLVGDGTYNSVTTITPGYTALNRVVITKDLTVRSQNGPKVTIIEGAGPLGSNAVRGVYMNAGTLSGFTVTNGHTQTSGHVYYDQSGGGIFCQLVNNPVVSNCIVSGNTAIQNGGGMYKGTANNCTFSGNEAAYGGGMYNSTANHCTFSNNEAGVNGGGMYDSTAHHCTFSYNDGGYAGGGMHVGTANHCIFSKNKASDGGGMDEGTANNCTFSENIAHYYGGGIEYVTANNCIIWGNTAGDDYDNTFGGSLNSCWTRDPDFVDASAENYHLQAGSPCIDTGDDSYVSTGDTDLDGNPRILSGTVDMGAYEFASEDADFDGDSMSDADENIAGTSMSDPNDYFHIRSITITTNGTTLDWTVVAGRIYSVWWAPALTNDFNSITNGLTDPPYTDATQTNGYYKMKVQL